MAFMGPRSQGNRTLLREGLAMSSSETLAEMSTWCVTCKLAESACTAQPSRLAVPGWGGASNGPADRRFS